MGDVKHHHHNGPLSSSFTKRKSQDQHPQEKSASKRKKNNSPNTSDEKETPSSSSSKSKEKGRKYERKSKRFTWPANLHRLFVASIFDVGLKNATPKALLSLMGSNAFDNGLTTEHLKSHLQKYRINYERSRGEFLRLFDESMKSSIEKQQQHRTTTKDSIMSIYPISIETCEAKTKTLPSDLNGKHSSPSDPGMENGDNDSTSTKKILQKSSSCSVLDDSTSKYQERLQHWKLNSQLEQLNSAISYGNRDQSMTNNNNMEGYSHLNNKMNLSPALEFMALPYNRNYPNPVIINSVAPYQVINSIPPNHLLQMYQYNNCNPGSLVDFDLNGQNNSGSNSVNVNVQDNMHLAMQSQMNWHRQLISKKREVAQIVSPLSPDLNHPHPASNSASTSLDSPSQELLTVNVDSISSGVISSTRTDGNIEDSISAKPPDPIVSDNCSGEDSSSFNEKNNEAPTQLNLPSSKNSNSNLPINSDNSIGFSSNIENMELLGIDQWEGFDMDIGNDDLFSFLKS